MQPKSFLKGHGFARIFLQNAINLGLRTIVCATIEAKEGDEMEIVGEAIINKSLAKEFPILPLPKSRQAIIAAAAGLISYTRTRLVEKSPAAAETGAQRSLVNLTTQTA